MRVFDIYFKNTIVIFLFIMHMKLILIHHFVSYFFCEILSHLKSRISIEIRNILKNIFLFVIIHVPGSKPRSLLPKTDQAGVGTEYSRAVKVFVPSLALNSLYNF